jgi:hypothetical protein
MFIISLSSSEEVISISTSSNQLQYNNGTDQLKIVDIEDNKWYQIKMYFETSDAYNYNLNQSTWKISINGTMYGDFQINTALWGSPKITSIDMRSDAIEQGWTTFLSDFNFSWNEMYPFEYNIVKFPIIVDYLRINYSYYFSTEEDSNSKSTSSEYIDIEEELIPNLCSSEIYNNDGISIYNII